MEVSEFREWKESIKQRCVIIGRWVELVASFKRDAPERLLELYERQLPEQKGLYSASNLKIDVGYRSLEVVERETRARLFYSMGDELYFGPHRSPYPVENTDFWPWTSLNYQCPAFDKHVWYKIILHTQDIRFWLTMSTVNKQFYEWIKTDCDTAKFPLWHDFNRERRLCFGVEPLMMLKSWEFAVVATRLLDHKCTTLGLLIIACTQVPFADMHKLRHIKKEDVCVKAKKYTIYVFRKKHKRNLTLRIDDGILGEWCLTNDNIRYLSHVLRHQNSKFGLQRELVFNSYLPRAVDLLLGTNDSPSNKRLKK